MDLLRAGRATTVALALVALLGLTTVPHHHETATDEQSCPACQVSRIDGAGVPETASVPAPPASAPELSSSRIRPAAEILLAHAAPLPSRGPPPVPPAEHL